MALHSVDKDNIDRNSPRPNTHDLRQDVSRMAHNTLGTTYKTTSDTTNTRIIFKNNLILYYDDQNRVIRVDGFIPSLAAYPVTIIANYGYDVFTDILGLTTPTV